MIISKNSLKKAIFRLISGRLMARRIMLQGYYWPTLLKDSKDYTRVCDNCRRFTPLHHMPSNELTSVSNRWPFIQ